MIHEINPIDRFGFTRIGEATAKYLKDTGRKPGGIDAEIIEWVKNPGVYGSHLSFTDAIKLAEHLNEHQPSGNRILPWGEVCNSIEANSDDVWRLQGVCPSCGEYGTIYRVYFESPDCDSLSAYSGYLYFCGHCKKQILLAGAPAMKGVGNRAGKANAIGRNEYIRDMGFSVRLSNCLRAADIETLNELLQIPMADLKRMRNFGKRCEVELKEALAKRGLDLL